MTGFVRLKKRFDDTHDRSRSRPDHYQDFSCSVASQPWPGFHHRLYRPLHWLTKYVAGCLRVELAASLTSYLAGCLALHVTGWMGCQLANHATEHPADQLFGLLALLNCKTSCEVQPGVGCSLGLSTFCHSYWLNPGWLYDCTLVTPVI